MWLPHSFIFLWVTVFASGAITNTTIDDSDSRFTFTGTWNAITPNSPCEICSAKPDASQTNGGTWHDGNYRDGAPVGTSGSFAFQGSAVYIFGIDQAISQPNIAFTLGNIQQVHHYTGTEQFAYNALFFSAEGLDPDQTHTVDWVFNLADTGVEVQAALFDYAIVTSGREDVPTSTSAGVGPAKPQSSTPTDKAGSASHSSSSFLKSQAPSAFGVSQSNNASQTKSAQSNPTRSPGDQSSSPSTVTEAGGVTTVTTLSQSASSRSKSNNLGAILGAVVGALAVAVLAILFLWHRCRRVHRVVPETDKAARSQFLRIDDYPMQNSPRPADTREAGILASSLKGHNAFGRLAGPSTASLLSPVSSPATTTHAESNPSIPPPEEPPAVNRPTNSATSRDLRLMEERLATLEAQIAVHQYPPPYIHENDD